MLRLIQSGQPYSIIDYSGAVGSLYYSTFDGITNPIVPLAPGCTAKTAVTGSSGAFYNEQRLQRRLEGILLHAPARFSRH